MGHVCGEGAGVCGGDEFVRESGCLPALRKGVWELELWQDRKRGEVPAPPAGKGDGGDPSGVTRSSVAGFVEDQFSTLTWNYACII